MSTIIEGYLGDNRTHHGPLTRICKDQMRCMKAFSKIKSALK